MEIKYLTPNQIKQIHHRVMEKYGEGEQAGILFEDAFLSAVVRPQVEYFGQEVYPTIWDKVGALIQSIAQGHVFHNGNKRTAFVVARVFLGINGYQLEMDEDEAEEMMVAFVTEDRFKGDNGAREIGKVIEEKVKAHY